VFNIIEFSLIPRRDFACVCDVFVDALIRDIASQNISICKTPTSLNILFIEIDHSVLARKIARATDLHLLRMLRR
jgi:hypothetical protein